MSIQINNRTSFFILLILLSTFSSCSENEADPASIFGKYKNYSEDPSINNQLINEDNYIEIKKENTIVYNTTINSKPKFNFKGNYTYDKAANTLIIEWSGGNLPVILKIEKVGKDQIIRIGDTFYKKKNPD